MHVKKLYLWVLCLLRDNKENKRSLRNIFSDTYKYSRIQKEKRLDTSFWDLGTRLRTTLKSMAYVVIAVSFDILPLLCLLVFLQSTMPPEFLTWVVTWTKLPLNTVWLRSSGYGNLVKKAGLRNLKKIKTLTEAY